MANNIPLLTIEEGDADWAYKFNNNFELLNTHSHSDAVGDGQIVQSQFVSCVSDVFFDSVTEAQISDIELVSFSEAILPVPKRSLFVLLGELWVQNGINVPIQLTKDGNLNITIVGQGGFDGKPGFYGAQATYTSAIKRYEFTGNGGGPATINAGSLESSTAVVQNATVNKKIKADTLTLSDFDPLAPPGSLFVLKNTLSTPSLEGVDLAQFATTGALARQSIEQSNFIQAFVETDYTTKLFSYETTFFAWKNGTTVTNYTIRRNTNYSSSPLAYPRIATNGITFGAKTLPEAASKKYDWICSLYDRDDLQKPPYISVGREGTLPTKPIIGVLNSNYDRTKFKVLGYAI